MNKGTRQTSNLILKWCMVLFTVNPFPYTYYTIYQGICVLLFFGSFILNKRYLLFKPEYYANKKLNRYSWVFVFIAPGCWRNYFGYNESVEWGEPIIIDGAIYLLIAWNILAILNLYDVPDADSDSVTSLKENK